mmetsp:Transcript_34/g.95  ORF Transcript_34/g.95 Transcript_34/m.95 type:complete len:301 (+) Transcript_34:115-1017(+)
MGHDYLSSLLGMSEKSSTTGHAATTDHVATTGSAAVDRTSQKKVPETKFKDVQWIETTDDCVDVTHELSSELEIAIDMQGINQGNGGHISIIQIGNKRGEIFLFDIIRLGTKAFSEGGLGFLLHSRKILKVLFDSKTKCKELLLQHNVLMRNVFDLQMFHFLKFVRKTDMTDLGRCLEEATPLMNIKDSQLESIQKIRKKALSLLSSDRADFDEIWNMRPLKKCLIVYAAADVTFLLPMKEAWERDSSSGLITRVTETSQDRCDEACCEILPDVRQESLVRPLGIGRHGLKEFFSNQYIP